MKIDISATHPDQAVTLEAAWHPATGHPTPGQPRAVVVATHPHPLYGGDMNNTAPSTLARELPDAGISVLRFNFRGVGASSGEHDEGRSERLDLHAAIAHAANEQPNVPVVVVGYSFGADVALDVLAEAPDLVGAVLTGVVAIAPPLHLFESYSTATEPLPKHLLVPEHDQFRPPESAAEFTAEWTATTSQPLEGTDHFLLGATTQLVEKTKAFVERQTS